jgi:hypothetical protein
LVYEEEDETNVDAQVQCKHSLFDLMLVLHKMLVMNFENLLNQSHLENKTEHKETTCWKPQEIIVRSQTYKYEMLPKQAKMPDNRNCQRHQRYRLGSLVVHNNSLHLANTNSNTKDYSK